MHKLRSANQTNRNFDLWIFFCLLLIEAITFGINLKNIGVYQDEWIYFGKLHFVQHSLTNLISALFWDPRITVRPLEALHFGPLFFLVWEKPFFYHLVCYIAEFLGGWFLFLAISNFSANRAVGLTAALLFLLYPNHDATHYYITASSEQISASFFTLSLWLFLNGVDRDRNSFILWSAIAYFCSLYNYEQTLPLVVLYPILYLFKLRQNKDPYKKSFPSFIACQIPFALVAASMIAYRTWLLPSLGLGWHYSTCYSLSNFISVILAGLNVSLSPYLLAFCTTMATDALKEGLSRFAWICLSAAAISIWVCLWKEFSHSRTAYNKNLPVIIIGLIALISSYTIFGFSPEHMPVIDAWRNRVNIGGSFGASLIIAGLFGMLKNIFPVISDSVKNMIFAAAIAALAGFFILVDWQFAKPWIVSWQTQKALMGVIQNHAREIKSGDSIIIGGITRYVKWAPVVDGVWDFENIVRTTLNNQHVKANVITERLTVEADRLVDRSGILILGEYPFKQMILYSPENSCWVRISTRKEFIQQAKRFGWAMRWNS